MMKCIEVCKKQAKAHKELQELIAKLNGLNYSTFLDALQEEEIIDWIVEQATFSAELDAERIGLKGEEAEVAVKEAVAREVADFYNDGTVMKADYKEVIERDARNDYSSAVQVLRYDIQKLESKIRLACHKCHNSNEILVRLFAEADYVIAKVKLDVAEKQFQAVDAEKYTTY